MTPAVQHRSEWKPNREGLSLPSKGNLREITRQNGASGVLAAAGLMERGQGHIKAALLALRPKPTSPTWPWVNTNGTILG